MASSRRWHRDPAPCAPRQPAGAGLRLPWKPVESHQYRSSFEMSLVYRRVSGSADWVSSSLKTAAITCVSVTAWASQPAVYPHIPPGADQIATAAPDGASDPSVASAC